MGGLSKLAVDRPITFLMTSLILIGFGIFGVLQLRLNLYPDVSFPTITIFTGYEGVAPEDMETLITRPIEENVGSISGIKRVRSLSSQGASVVKLNFNWGTDLYEAENDVRKQLGSIERSIPRDAETPLVFSYDPNQEPIIVLALTSEARSSRDLRTYATQILEQRIERVNGIASAETSGGLERQINVIIDNEKMRLYNLTIAQISTRLSAENIQVPAGQLTEGNTVYSLRTMGELKSVEQIKNTVVATRNGQSLFLRDVAEVEDGIAQPIGNVRVDGEDGVIINVYRQSDANVVVAAEAVIENLEEIKKSLPADVQVEVLTNKAEFIKQSIENLLLTGVQAIILVVLILLAFLRSGRSALIIAISIPVSIVTTFAVMDFADLSLNIISLSGLTLAVGLVVDDAVVVLENIFRFREEGKGRKDAAIMGAKEVAVPVVISTLTTLVVFLPILFVPGIAGFLFRDLALTISFSLSVSSLVALTLIPMMTSQFYKDGELSIEATNKVANFFSELLNKLEKWYSEKLDKALHKSGLVVLVAIVFFVATLPIFNMLGGEFFPRVDENAFNLEVTREAGVSLLELERSIGQVESIIMKEVPEARIIVSDYGDKEGIEGADNPGGFTGSVRVELVPKDERSRTQFEVVSDLLKKLEIVPGVSIQETIQDPLSPDGENGLIVQIFGFDPEVKKNLSDGVKEKITQIDGVVSAYSTADQGRPELRLVLDRERIALVGMNTNQVATALSDAVQGNIATSFVDQGVEFEVKVELDPRQKAASTDLENIQIQTPAGDWLPLRTLARIERYTGPTNVTRINQERVVEILTELDGVDLKTASTEARTILDEVEWPDGYRYALAGSAEEQAESFNFLLIAFAIAGILTYMVMASQFESLIEPFIIIFTIPLALSGVLIILGITGTAISVTSMVGLILLSGIVVNNGIVMIDYIKILQARGVDRHKAIVQGATRRLRPILMTALTTILSMVPLALELGSGSETWSPMARTVIGGLTMSTILMLFVVPSIYNLINRGVDNLGFDAVHKTDPLLEKNEVLS
ncbi:MAG: efflux RND transporter permease subunit [Balneola sp.]|nr:efflux RND transporter permease subunit [Balneola sp.]MBO6650319.1 efflux RND transporter permease subunit [Balneola sp.]MBO6712094.1 efflux RND transporter permease subunit [Balneola sp.]MBO6800288.1 efflux RND transporter permease subunit [Balneola sp.]MBO6869698.1 efflux RND transporter permease subunit [Balneola sp.]